MERSVAVAVSSAPSCSVSGEFMRHVSPKIDDLVSSAAGGRWGPPGAFSVLYLGRPQPSVVIEAYRHLVDDDLDGMPPSAVGPRRFITCQVNVERILDLRDPTALSGLDLDAETLRSNIGTYGPCHRIALAAHQLELWGISARCNRPRRDPGTIRNSRTTRPLADPDGL